MLVITKKNITGHSGHVCTETEEKWFYKSRAQHA